MTLFTAEGLLVAKAQAGDKEITDTVGLIHQAYLRWLETQRFSYTETGKDQVSEGRLLAFPEMWKIKALGNTCLNALRIRFRSRRQHRSASFT